MINKMCMMELECDGFHGEMVKPVLSRGFYENVFCRRVVIMPSGIVEPSTQGIHI